MGSPMIVVLAFLLLLALGWPAALAHAQSGAATEDSLRAWARVAEVLRHPRCMNCHPSGDVPRQADDRHLHRML